MSEPTPPSWPEQVFDVLRAAHVRQVAYVPDAGHARLIDLCRGEPAMRSVVLTAEQEGVAVLAGAWLGGQRGALLMQSSGVGNCVNLLAMVQECRFPLLMLVTMRGQWAEFNPWQVPMGQAAERVLHEVGVIVQRAETPDEVPRAVQSAAALAFDAGRAVAVLIGQRVVGRKRWDRGSGTDE